MGWPRSPEAAWQKRRLPHVEILPWHPLWEGVVASTTRKADTMPVPSKSASRTKPRPKCARDDVVSAASKRSHGHTAGHRHQPAIPACSARPEHLAQRPGKVVIVTCNITHVATWRPPHRGPATNYSDLRTFWSPCSIVRDRRVHSAQVFASWTKGIVRHGGGTRLAWPSFGFPQMARQGGGLEIDNCWLCSTGETITGICFRDSPRPPWPCSRESARAT